MTNPPDDRYPRRTFTLDPKANELLDHLALDTGKGFSEIVCLGLLSLAGDRKMLRHTLAQPLNTLRLNCNMLASIHPDDEPVHQIIREQFQRIEQAIAPPVVKPSTS